MSEDYPIEPRRPCSRAQMDKLGRRLVVSDPSQADVDLYGDVIEYFDSLQGHVRYRLDAIGWGGVLGRDVAVTVTGRAKTRDTLLDKLRRTPQIGMGHVQDIAGVRIVADITLVEQDKIAESIRAEFPGSRAKLID